MLNISMQMVSFSPQISREEILAHSWKFHLLQSEGDIGATQWDSGRGGHQVSWGFTAFAENGKGDSCCLTCRGPCFVEVRSYKR